MWTSVWPQKKSPEIVKIAAVLICGILRSNASSDGHGLQGQSVDHELSIDTSFILTHQELE